MFKVDPQRLTSVSAARGACTAWGTTRGGWTVMHWFSSCFSPLGCVEYLQALHCISGAQSLNMTINSWAFLWIFLDHDAALDTTKMLCNPLQSSSVSSFHPFFQTERGSPCTKLRKPFKDEYRCEEHHSISGSSRIDFHAEQRKCWMQMFFRFAFTRHGRWSLTS